jgi:hypothetical protein
MNTTENPAELEQLKQEVARLREEMRQLTRFIHYHPAGEDDDGKPLAEHLSIICWNITMMDPREPGKTQINLNASQYGPSIHLMDRNEKLRAALTVEDDAAELCLKTRDSQEAISLREEKGASFVNLYGPENKIGVQLHVDGPAGNGMVGVCEAGNPRAVMKAIEDKGIISAVHNGGQARVTIISQEASGEIMLVNPDMRVAVKLSTQGQRDEGFITVNHSNGHAAVILSALPEHGCVMVNDRAGQVKYSLPSPSDI